MKSPPHGIFSHIEVVEIALNLKLSQHVHYVVLVVSNAYRNLYGVFNDSNLCVFKSFISIYCKHVMF